MGTMTGEELLWDLAEALYRDPAVTRSTMMGFPCLRYEGRFFASVDRNTQALLVKLPQPRVEKLIQDGHGEPFAPAGRVFREWVAVTRPDRRRWRALLDEARSHAAGAEQPKPPSGFGGFDTTGFTFLAGLGRDNTKGYFDAHRDLYQRGLLEPAKAFVVALGELLTARVSKQLRAEPRIGGSMFRIANDLRFAHGRPPYKTHLDFAFWEGEGGPRRDPALILRLTPTHVLLGAGVPALTGAGLQRYRAALRDPVRLAELDSAVDDLLTTGAELSEPTRARAPAGIDPAGPAGRYAIRDSLYLTRRFPRPKAATTAGFPQWCARRLEPFGPVHRWLVRALTA
jgi:uncharacterized protein (TIGR02453 family)